MSGDTDNQFCTVTGSLNIELLSPGDTESEVHYADLNGSIIDSTLSPSFMFYFDNICSNISKIRFSVQIQYTGSYQILSPYATLYDRDDYSSVLATDTIDIAQTGSIYSLTGILNIDKISNPKILYDAELNIIIPLING